MCGKSDANLNIRIHHYSDATLTRIEILRFVRGGKFFWGDEDSANRKWKATMEKSKSKKIFVGGVPKETRPKR